MSGGGVNPVLQADSRLGEGPFPERRLTDSRHSLDHTEAGPPPCLELSRFLVPVLPSAFPDLLVCPNGGTAGADFGRCRDCRQGSPMPRSGCQPGDPTSAARLAVRRIHKSGVRHSGFAVLPIIGTRSAEERIRGTPSLRPIPGGLLPGNHSHAPTGDLDASNSSHRRAGNRTIPGAPATAPRQLGGRDQDGLATLSLGDDRDLLGG